MASPIARLIEFGQSPWYDNLTRALASGGLAELVTDHGIRGVTSNPTILEKALAAGTDYDAQLRAVSTAGATTDAAYWDLVVDDIAHAADILRPHYDEWDGRDGFVSLEVAPTLGGDTNATLAQAKELWARLDRPNVMIKIPATAEGVPAIADALAAGINVNVTLIFGLARYDEVLEAFLSGLEQRLAAGGDISRVASVGSFFVSRVDTETDRRLPEGHPLRGKAAVANAKLAYQHFLQAHSGPRWEALAAKGARVQRPLWASTSTKNPDYPPTLYVDTLIGRDTVNTLAQASVDALEAGKGTFKADAVLDDVDGARATIAALAEAGVDFDDVTETLEREGVAAFSASFTDALESLDKKAHELTR